jgi:hypothetical protein
MEERPWRARGYWPHVEDAFGLDGFSDSRAGNLGLVAPSEAGSAAPQEETRRANERLVRAVGHIIQAEKHVPLLCECADPFCMEPVPMTLGEYETVRSHPRRFALVPGHTRVAGERIVGKDSRFEITEKAE